jgi:hypothetical protein
VPPECGQKSLVCTFVNLLTGGIQTVNEVTLDITPGQGMMLLDPPTLPMIGEITEGTLVLCSEFFPALAPLRMQLTGADIRFLVQNGRLISCNWRAGERTLLRIQCAPTPDAAVKYRLENRWRLQAEKRILIHRIKQLADQVLEHRTLSVEVLRGDIRGLGKPTYTGAYAQFERLDLVREQGSGVLELRLLASWFELSFRDGALRRLRCFEESGLVASIALLPATCCGGAHSVAFRDVLP